jgi:hypothetical protein
MDKVTLDLPLSKETPGAYRFGFTEGRRDHVISDLYVRKDQLAKAGYTGGRPVRIVVTVEVLDS